MLTTIEPCWEFKTCTGYLVGDFKGSYFSPMKVYVSSIMAKIKRSLKPKKTKVTIKSPSELYLNEPSTMPNTSTRLIELNYIEVLVKDDIIKKKANEDLYDKFKQEKIYPKPIYYIPFDIELSAGHPVSISGWGNSLLGLIATHK